MVDNNRVSVLCDQLRLSPYQSYILQNNSKKYDLGRLIKRGGVLYAPYARIDTNIFARILFGPRADLIGADRLLIHDRRGVKIYPTGFFSAYENGIRYFADANGNRVGKGFFYRV
jgi:hypothetical protein